MAELHLPAPAHIDYAHFRVTKVNKIHQADLVVLNLTTNYMEMSINTRLISLIFASQVHNDSRPLRTKKG